MTQPKVLEGPATALSGRENPLVDEGSGSAVCDVSAQQPADDAVPCLNDGNDIPPDVLPLEEVDSKLGSHPAFARITHIKKRAVLVALSVTPMQGRACTAAGITRHTLYNWLHGDDEDFKAAYAVAFRMGIEAAEEIAWKRAMEGREEPVFQGGVKVGTKRVPSDLLTIFMLKGAAPEKYRDRFEHVGANGGPVEIIVTRRIVDADGTALVVNNATGTPEKDDKKIR